MSDEITLVRGTLYEDHHVGRRFQHRWGRTLTRHDVIEFATMTSQYNPLYFDLEHALAEGHPDVVAPSLLVYNIALGLSVEDLSEAGGPFLSIRGMTFPAHAYPGDTIRAESVVVERRLSSSRPGWGIVTWDTTGRNQRDAVVVHYRRANLARCREQEQ